MRHVSKTKIKTCSWWTQNVICKSATTTPNSLHRDCYAAASPHHSLSKRDSWVRERQQTEQTVHSSVCMTRMEHHKIPLLTACCYRRNQQDGARGELLSPDRSRFCSACAFMHVCVCVGSFLSLSKNVKLCVLMLSRCSLRSPALFDTKLHL